jgi:DDE superfamily endonuclease
VPDRGRGAPAQDRAGRGDRPGRRPQKELIERAYRVAEALGLALWCQDEAGPYQAVPHPGPSWQPEGAPARRPHEYVRGGTAKLLTLFRPATGQVRATPVASAPNAVLHPWLKAELTAALAALPPLAPEAAAARAARAAWEAWQEGLRVRFTLPADLPPLRGLLVWDNLTGHKTPELVLWLCAQGVMPLYTPLGGSWLNMAESVQRILARRALDGQHPTSAQDVMDWLAATVRGWNAHPTAFVWGGDRQRRRWRARQRRHALHAVGGSGAVPHQPLPRRARRASVYERLCA